MNLNLFPAPLPHAKMDAQLKGWLAWIDFELSNPECLEPFGLRSRVRFVFELALTVQRFNPALWHEYAQFEYGQGDTSASSAIYVRGMVALEDSELLAFVFADHKEMLNDIAGAETLYETLLRHHPSPLAYINYQRFARRAYGAQGLDKARVIFKRARKDQRPNACSHHVFSAVVRHWTWYHGRICHF